MPAGALNCCGKSPRPVHRVRYFPHDHRVKCPKTVPGVDAAARAKNRITICNIYNNIVFYQVGMVFDIFVTERKLQWLSGNISGRKK
jgi:hypothetical protein